MRFYDFDSFLSNYFKSNKVQSKGERSSELGYYKEQYIKKENRSINVSSQIKL